MTIFDREKKYTYPGSDLRERGFVKKVARTGTRSTHYYQVTKSKKMEWPVDDVELINFCDGGPCNFGGQVIKYDDWALVIVYVD